MELLALLPLVYFLRRVEPRGFVVRPILEVSSGWPFLPGVKLRVKEE